jgi:HK97 family phage major capsid protein
MGWWFGRKSAPADARPFVPAWLRSDATEEGFARSYSTRFREVYEQNPIGQRCVRLVAGILGSLTIDGPSTIPGQAAVGLVTADGLLEGIAANLLLHGNAYRQGAVFVMNSATAAEIRKFRTSTGAFLFQPSLAAGQPATLLGYPLIEAEDMPDIAAGSLSIAFGNFKAGYVIAERNATTILRDPYTHKPYVHFYATKRVGGQIVNSEAIKLLKFA